MLDNGIGHYIDSLTEREFDAPFVAMLRLHGFTDIHFLHGAFEFGKDFIAKRTESDGLYQYCFQTKAGDIGLAQWHPCRGQIDMLRTNSLAHPNFDVTLPRQARFVTTGRLIGAAAVEAQQYRDHLAALGETQFLVWDRDTLIEMLAVDPASLTGSSNSLWRIVGSEGHLLTFEVLEQHSRGWIRSSCGSSNLKDCLEAAVIANHCRLQNRIDLACYTALMLIRSTWATAHGRDPLPDAAAIAIDTGKALFRHYAKHLRDACLDHYLDSDSMIREDPTPSGFATYPVRCLTVLEILSMLALLEPSEEQSALVTYLADFVCVNAGASHPISDRWGVSFVPALLLFHVHGRDEALRLFLRSATKWVADRYDRGDLGLAGPYASPEEEVDYLLGSPFEHVAPQRRRASYLATVILDICCVLEEQELYNLARNEFLSVGICLPVLEVDDTVAQYSLQTTGQRYEPNMLYEDHWNPSDGWKNAPHHRRQENCFYPELAGQAWDQLAISCVVRDRHFVHGWRRVASMPAPNLGRSNVL
jgi:hypothetical protein